MREIRPSGLKGGTAMSRPYLIKAMARSRARAAGMREAPWNVVVLHRLGALSEE